MKLPESANDTDLELEDVHALDVSQRNEVAPTEDQRESLRNIQLRSATKASDAAQIGVLVDWNTNPEEPPPDACEEIGLNQSADGIELQVGREDFISNLEIGVVVLELLQIDELRFDRKVRMPTGAENDIDAQAFGKTEPAEVIDVLIRNRQ